MAARLGASVLLLGVLLWICLYFFLTLLLPGEMILDLSHLPEGQPSELALAKVSLFLVTFVVLNFVVQASTQEEMRKEMFADLTSKLRDWERVLILYEVYQTRGYQRWNGPLFPNEIDAVELEIVVSPYEITDEGTTVEEDEVRRDEKVKQACTDAAKTWSARTTTIVNAFEYRESGVYDLDVSGRRWQLLRIPQGESFTRWHKLDNERVRYEHSLGTQNERTGQDVPWQWFGRWPKDQNIGQDLWQSEDIRSICYRPYVCSGGSEEQEPIYGLVLIRKPVSWRR